jgi:hypothetical protein
LALSSEPTRLNLNQNSLGLSSKNLDVEGSIIQKAVFGECLSNKDKEQREA